MRPLLPRPPVYSPFTDCQRAEASPILADANNDVRVTKSRYSSESPALYRAPSHPIRTLRNLYAIFPATCALINVSPSCSDIGASLLGAGRKHLRNTRGFTSFMGSKAAPDHLERNQPRPHRASLLHEDLIEPGGEGDTLNSLVNGSRLALGHPGDQIYSNSGLGRLRQSRRGQQLPKYIGRIPREFLSTAALMKTSQSLPMIFRCASCCIASIGASIT
jgi:hypothetical protein